MENNYQVVIIGGGPAGLTAGLYLGRARSRTLLIEKGPLGGRIVNAELVENYPGFPDGIAGYELAGLMETQARKHGLDIVTAEVEKIEVKDSDRVIVTGEGTYHARALIVAGGSEHETLGVPGEIDLIGKGVSFCATCDGAFFKNENIAVVGGGNSALNEALFLTRFASKVTVIHRRDQLRATKALQEKAFADPKVSFIWDTAVVSVEGENQVKKLRLVNLKTKQERDLEVSGVFVAVGLRPSTAYLEGIVALSPEHYIVVNDMMETNVPGIFAAGDIRAGSGRQVACAVGDGATAAIYAERFVSLGQ